MIRKSEYEVCKQRGHQEHDYPGTVDLRAWQMMRQSTEWKECRWCGCLFKTVTVPREIEAPNQQFEEEQCQQQS